MDPHLKHLISTLIPRNPHHKTTNKDRHYAQAHSNNIHYVAHSLTHFPSLHRHTAPFPCFLHSQIIFSGSLFSIFSLSRIIKNLPFSKIQQLKISKHFPWSRRISFSRSNVKLRRDPQNLSSVPRQPPPPFQIHGKISMKSSLEYPPDFSPERITNNMITPLRTINRKMP